MPRSATLNGILLIVLGGIAMIAPLFSSVWGVAFVGGAIFTAGVIELADAWYSDSRSTHYSSGVFSVFAGALIALQSAFAFSGLMVVTSLVLLADGGNASSGPSRQEPWQLALGLFQRPRQHRPGTARVVAARHHRRARIWILPRPAHGRLGLADAGRVARSDGDEFTKPEDEHPDRALGLPPHPIIGFMHRDAIVQATSRTSTDFYWSLVFVAVFFAIHVGRVDAEWTLLGLLTPRSRRRATSWRLSSCRWSSCCRSNGSFSAAAARSSGRCGSHAQRHRTGRGAALERACGSLLGRATPAPFGGARPRERPLHRRGPPTNPGRTADHRGPHRGQSGLGFSCKLNSENWATAAWQKIAESRVDEWREAMIDAAVRVRGAAGVTPGSLRRDSRRPWRRRFFRSSSSAIPARRSSQHALRNRCCARRGVTR